MPTMDTSAKADSSVDDNSLTSVAPSSEGASDVEKTPSLDVPSHDEADFAKPETDVEKVTDVSNKVDLKKSVEKMIKVVAKAQGFYNNRRIVPEEVFYIKSKAHFGSWFRCLDEELEQERREFVKERTLKARKKAQLKKARE